jgi:methyl-accepting chemotaxis protein
LTHEPRRRLLVEPRLQSALISPFLLLFVPATLVFFSVTWGVLRDVEEMARTLGLPVGHPFFVHLTQLRMAAAAAVAATCLGVVALTVYGGLLRTRRIAGPIAALRHQLERAARGDGFAEVQTRRGDWFGDVQEGINRLLVRPPESH